MPGYKNPTLFSPFKLSPLSTMSAIPQAPAVNEDPGGDTSKKFLCPFCTSSFSSKENLARHKSRAHAVPVSFIHEGESKIVQTLPAGGYACFCRPTHKFVNRDAITKHIAVVHFDGQLPAQLDVFQNLSKGKFRSRPVSLPLSLPFPYSCKSRNNASLHTCARHHSRHDPASHTT